jgi:hypothetical protein
MLSSINQLSISNQHRFRGQKQVRCHEYPYVCAHPIVFDCLVSATQGLKSSSAARVAHG